MKFLVEQSILVDSPQNELSNDAICIVWCSIFAEKIALENCLAFLAFLNGHFQNCVKTFPLDLLLQ